MENVSIPPLIITIDGPAGAGKTTISKLLANRLGFKYIDTGALYRGVALAALDAGVAPNNDDKLGELCSQLQLDFEMHQGDLRLMLNQSDVSDQIRTPRISMLASDISARPVVRHYLLDIQRTIGVRKRIVVEGRDMGTVVFPEAEIKFFLDADPQIRAARRHAELRAKNQTETNFEDVAEDMARRDRNDRSRAIAPLVPAPDAVRIDSTQMGIDEVVHAMADHIFTQYGIISSD